MPKIYDLKAVKKIKDYLLSRNETLALAESVTSGQLQVAFSLADNATDFFQGGITAYNLGQKCRHLRVEPIHAESCNCVSEKIAIEIALEASRLFISDWAISVTGYAAPIPALKIRKLFAYYAICYRNKTVESSIIHTPKSSVYNAQLSYVNTIIQNFASLLGSW